MDAKQSKYRNFESIISFTNEKFATEIITLAQDKGILTELLSVKVPANYTVLHRAAYKGYGKVIEKLLSFNEKLFKKMYCTVSSFRTTPLQDAMQNKKDCGALLQVYNQPERDLMIGAFKKPTRDKFEKLLLLNISPTDKEFITKLLADPNPTGHLKGGKEKDLQIGKEWLFSKKPDKVVKEMTDQEYASRVDVLSEKLLKKFEETFTEPLSKDVLTALPMIDHRIPKKKATKEEVFSALKETLRLMPIREGGWEKMRLTGTPTGKSEDNYREVKLFYCGILENLEGLTALLEGKGKDVMASNLVNIGLAKLLGYCITRTKDEIDQARTILQTSVVSDDEVDFGEMTPETKMAQLSRHVLNSIADELTRTIGKGDTHNRTQIAFILGIGSTQDRLANVTKSDVLNGLSKIDVVGMYEDLMNKASQGFKESMRDVLLDSAPVLSEDEVKKREEDYRAAQEKIQTDLQKGVKGIIKNRALSKTVSALIGSEIIQSLNVGSRLKSLESALVYMEKHRASLSGDKLEAFDEKFAEALEMLEEETDPSKVIAFCKENNLLPPFAQSLQARQKFTSDIKILADTNTMIKELKTKAAQANIRLTDQQLDQLMDLKSKCDESRRGLVSPGDAESARKSEYADNFYTEDYIAMKRDGVVALLKHFKIIEGATPVKT